MLDVMIFFIILFVTYLLIDNSSTKLPKKKYSSDKYKLYLNNLFKKEKETNFIDMQYHADYADVISAFEKMESRRANTDNHINIEEDVMYDMIESYDVKGITNSFINDLNVRLNEKPESELGVTVKKSELSEWEKYRIGLGLAPTIYNKPITGGLISLYKIDRAKKRVTNSVTEYIVTMTLQREGVRDRQIIKICFTEDMQSTESGTRDAYIDNIFVVGYLTQVDREETSQIRKKLNREMVKGLVSRNTIIRDMISQKAKDEQRKKLLKSQLLGDRV